MIALEPDAHNAGRIREHLALDGYTAEVIEKGVPTSHRHVDGMKIDVEDSVAEILRGHGYLLYRPDRDRGDLHRITGSVPTGTDVFASPEESPNTHARSVIA